MINLKILQNIDHVRILAKEAAQKTREDQVIYEGYEKRYRIFKFKPARKHTGAKVELVRYTKEVERGNVLRDNVKRKPGTTKGKSKGKRKSGSTK